MHWLEIKDENGKGILNLDRVVVFRPNPDGTVRAVLENGEIVMLQASTYEGFLEHFVMPRLKLQEGA